MNQVTGLVRRHSSKKRQPARVGLLLGSVLCLLLLAACAPLQRPAAAAPAAVPAAAAQVTLQFAVSDADQRPSAPYVNEFIDQVKALSNGSITIEPVWDAGSNTADGFERGVIQEVRKGTFPLGLAASRTWDTQGLPNFQALQAPFLITNDDLAEAVATGDIGARVLASLPVTDVVGLTMWPEDLRHPFSVIPDKPLLTPDDFKGLTIRSGPSNVTDMMLKTLGARPLFEDSGYQGAESGLRQGYTLNGKPIATANVTFYPKFQILFANGAAFAQLSEEQRTVLRQAAAAVQKKAIAEHPRDVDAGKAWCDDGNTIALASDAEVAAFEQVEQPVFDMIAQDPINAELIAAIRELKANTTPSPGATACAPTETAEAASVPSASAAVTSTTSVNLPRIVFSSFRDGNTELYLMNADGTGQTRLTNNAFWDDEPTASRDGKRIAFASDRDGNDEIYTMDIDGSNVLRLTNNQAKDGLPAFSPDGTQIVFFSERDGNVEIYRMNVDGSDQINLTNNPGLDHYPSWSPDGNQIIFNSARDGHASSNEVLDPNGEVYVMKPDGSDQTRLTHDGGNDGRPLWSPDGKQIIVDTDRGQPAEIYAMNPDGSGQTRLTHNVGQIGSIAWSLDGKQISFTSEVTGDDEIYVMNADGTNITQLTNSPGQDTWSAWLPAAGTNSAAFDGLFSGLAGAPGGAAAGAVLWIDNGDPEEADLVKELQQAQPAIDVTLQEDSHAGNDFNFDVAPLPSMVTVGTGPDFGKTLDQHNAADLTGIWEQSGLATAVPASLQKLTARAGKQYYVPAVFGWEAIYYNKQVFAQYGLQPPSTWEQLLAVNDVLRSHDETPLVISADGDSRGYWFQYLVLRMYGAEVYHDLTNGHIAFSDPRVRHVMEIWQALFARGDLKALTQGNDQDMMMALVRGDKGTATASSGETKAVMALTDGHVASQLAPELLDELGFFRFPIIDPALPVTEATYSYGYGAPAGQALTPATAALLTYAGSAAGQAVIAHAHTDMASGRGDLAGQQDPAQQQAVALFQQADTAVQDYYGAMPGMLVGMFNNSLTGFVNTPQNIDGPLSQLEVARQVMLDKGAFADSTIGSSAETTQTASALVGQLLLAGPTDATSPVSAALAFEIDASDPAVAGTFADHQEVDGIDHVDFDLFGPDGQQLYHHLERWAPYCAFDDGDPCNVYDFSEHNFQWPKGQAIVNGPLHLLATIYARDGRVKTVDTTVMVENLPG